MTIDSYTHRHTRTALHILFWNRIKEKDLKQKTKTYYNQYYFQSICNRYRYYSYTHTHLLTHTIPKYNERRKTETENKQVLESLISFTIHIQQAWLLTTHTQTLAHTHTSLHILFRNRKKEEKKPETENKELTKNYYNQWYHLQSIYNRQDY